MKIKTVTVSNFRRLGNDASKPGVSITAELEEGDTLEDVTRELRLSCEVEIACHAELIRSNREVIERALQDEAFKNAQRQGMVGQSAPPPQFSSAHKA